MAFTGVAVVTQITDGLCRITGLSLAPAAVGTIGLFGSGAGVELPDGFNPKPYDGIDLAESVQFSAVPAAANPAGVAPALQVGKTASPFLITLTNNGAAATAALEMWVRFH